MTSTSYPKHRLYDKNEQLDINLHIGSLCVDAKVSSEYKILQEAYFADKFFNVGKSRFKLRQFLFAEYNKRGFIFIEQVKEGVSVILKEAALKNKADNTDNFLPMNQIFTCKCGWLLFNPSTLPCGHTMCKHCADENLFCIICGYAFDEPSNPNLFLVQLMVLWFPLEYQSSQHKLDAKTLLVSEDFELALNEIDTCISLVKNDYSAFQLRAEIYLKLEKYQSALSDATMSCTLNPNCGKSQFLRGSCFSQLGKLNDAIDAFQLCLELEPEDMALCNSVINKLDSILSLPDTGAALGNESSEEATISKKTETEKEPPEPSCSSHRTDQQKDVENGGPELETKVAKQTLEENSEIPDLLDTEIKKIHGVPKKLIKESDFECRLCFELLFMPITTSCGHIFCKSCLLRSLDHNVACPICRTSLAEFLRNTMKPVTKIVEDILKLFFNEEFNTRKQQHSNKMDRLSRVGKDESVEVPIFVCSIAFPYVKCPLHIFEPKYRLMIRESIESGSRKFGMCVPQSGGDNFSDIGTICEITKVQKLPDGRFIITATAGQRFIVQEKITIDSMQYAKVKYFNDEPEDLSNENCSSLSRLVYNNLSQYMSLLNESEQACIINALGPLPAYENDFSQFQYGMPWIWWGLATLPLNFSAKLVLLRSKCVSERMLSLRRFLRFLTRMQTTTTNATTTTNTLTHSSSN